MTTVNEDGTALAAITKARQALAQAQDIYAVLEIRDIAKAAATLAEARNAGDAANEAKEVQLRAERKAGVFLKTLERGTAGRPPENTFQPETNLSDYAATIEDVGISRPTAHRWQKIAEVPEPEFERFVVETKEAGQELTQAAALRLATPRPHVVNNSGNNEWYTPPEYIEAARVVMGAIDLDPASSAAANGIIGANTFYSVEDDGLVQPWFGRIWMNPPYAQPLVTHFTARIVEQYELGNVEQACVLVNNASDTRWFQNMLKVCAGVCLIEGRIRFLDQDGNASGAPLQGQAVLYFGDVFEMFRLAFNKFGAVLHG